MAEWSQFRVRVNGGPEQDFETRTGVYRDAAAAAYAMLASGDDRYPAEVEIWVPHLVDAGYGPYRYLISEDEFGNLVVRYDVGSQPQLRTALGLAPFVPA